MAMTIVDAGVLNQLIPIAVSMLLGAYVTWEGVRFFGHPRFFIRDWMPWVPIRKWSIALVRAWACLCVFGGTFVVLATVVTEVGGYTGVDVVIGVPVLSALSTYMLLPIHHIWEKFHHIHEHQAAEPAHEQAE